MSVPRYSYSNAWRAQSRKPRRKGCRWRKKSGRDSPRVARPAALSGLYELQCAEAIEWAVDEEDLHRDVGLDVGLAEEREHLAAGELLDRLSVALGHHALEVLTHRDHALGLAAVHDRLLERGKAAAAHDHDDDVVERVGLGLHRAATVVLAQDADDAGRDRRQQMSACEWPIGLWRFHLVHCSAPVVTSAATSSAVSRTRPG